MYNVLEDIRFQRRINYKHSLYIFAISVHMWWIPSTHQLHHSVDSLRRPLCVCELYHACQPLSLLYRNYLHVVSLRSHQVFFNKVFKSFKSKTPQTLYNAFTLAKLYIRMPIFCSAF